jgi:uncharacterized repeat protein (TIGR04076 family)
MEFSDIKITVVKKVETGEIHEEFAVEGAESVCPLVKLGAEFVSKNMGVPDGFCSWAWADIHRDVAHLAMGGDFPWMREKGEMVSCCTDGLRPVIFKLERL